MDISKIFNYCIEDSHSLQRHLENPYLLSEKNPNRVEEEKKIFRVAMRQISAVAMLFSAIFAIRSLGKPTFVATVFSLGVSTLAYAVFHDIFVIHKNVDNNAFQQAKNVTTSLLATASDVFKGNKTSPGHHPLATGTYLKFLWNKVLSDFDLNLNYKPAEK